MTTRSPTAPTSSSALIVHQLAELLRKNGHRVLHGDNKVCFTSDSLNLLNNYFQAAKIDITGQSSYNHSQTNTLVSVSQLSPIQHLRISPKLRDDLIFLCDFLQKIQVVKLIHNLQTLQGNVFLYPFQHVTCLELKRIPPHMVLGLSVLRPKLETLICTQSVKKIEDLIGDCGGDLVTSQVWPKLKSLFLSHNFIERIDQSLKYLVELEVLDLSHNHIKDCSKILELVPRVKHLNLSSNHLRSLPIWTEGSDPCPLLTLKLRQNSIEYITGIERMKSIEELDLSDNLITTVPEQIRYIPTMKRLYLTHNPFTYAPNYREKVINHLPYVFSQQSRELFIDNRLLTLKEKQKITLVRQHPPSLVPRYTIRSVTPSSQTTASESTTDNESTGAFSTGTIMSRRRARQKSPGNLRSTDTDKTPTENATSDSDNESNRRKDRINRPPLLHTNSNSNQTPLLSTIMEPNDDPPKNPVSLSRASSITRKVTNEISQSPKRRKSPRSRKPDVQTKIFLEFVDNIPSNNDDTPVPGSPEDEKKISFKEIKIEVPTADFNTFTNHKMIGDSLRTIFFVIDQPANGEQARSLIVEIDALYLIEKDNNDDEYLEKIQYSTIKLLTDHENNNKIVEFTFEKRRGQIERRMYIFDTIDDQKAFVDEILRHLEPSKHIEPKITTPKYITCADCHQNFQFLTTMNNNVRLCMTCQNASNHIVSNEPTTKIDLENLIETTFNELDHRLHFKLAIGCFTHDDEKIILNFKSFIVRSTSKKYFIGQTIFTDYGIYIFQYDGPNDDIEKEYILVGKDLLTNVLMLDVGYRLQTLTIELPTAAFAFILGDEEKTQKVTKDILNILLPIVEKGEGALRKISRISSDEYRQRLFDIIKIECNINEPTDDIITFYSTMIRKDPNGDSQMIALLIFENWILMIEDEYSIVDEHHIRLPAKKTSKTNGNLQLKCDLMHLVNVINSKDRPKHFIVDFVDESETKQFQWRLESLTHKSKNLFLENARFAYKQVMHVPMTETFDTI